jgi:integrase
LFELRKLLNGFLGTTLFGIVATAALTGARRGEILALRRTDFDPKERTLRIERALEKAAGKLTFIAKDRTRHSHNLDCP